jgi:hypothetical protein
VAGNNSSSKATNDKIFDIVWGIPAADADAAAADEKADSGVKTRRENYEIIREYSEYSTIAGLIYIFMRDQVLLILPKVTNNGLHLFVIPKKIDRH